MAEVVPLTEINPDIHDQIALFREIQEAIVSCRNTASVLGFVAVAYATEGFPEALEIAKPLIALAVAQELGRRIFKYAEDFTIRKNPTVFQERPV